MSSHTVSQQLTKYPSGSIREIWTLSFPLMLSSVSGTLMFFLDRLILASHSTEALDAAVAAGMPCFTFHFGAIAIAAIAEVLVGQFNGSKQYKKLGIPVWQMIWFCIATSIIYIPLAIWGIKFLVPVEYQESGKHYFQILMGTGSLYALVPALSAFFVGKGTVKIVTYTVIFGNLVNLILDYIFIFGWYGAPAMGATGAALATAISVVVQIIILFAIFLNKKNIEKYGTNIITFDKKVLLKCLKIGWPNSLGHMVELAAWTFTMHILARVGEDYITVFAVGQGFFVLFTFAVDGLNKGVIAVTSNLLGAKNPDKVPEVFQSAIKLHFIFIVLLMVPNLLYPEILVKNFLYSSHNNPELINKEVLDAASFSMFLLWLYFIIDGIVWIVAGILTAAGRNLFVLFANAFNAWCFNIVPLLIIYNFGTLGLTTSWKVGLIYGFINVAIFYLRYKSGVWRDSRVL